MKISKKDWQEMINQRSICEVPSDLIDLNLGSELHERDNNSNVFLEEKLHSIEKKINLTIIYLKEALDQIRSLKWKKLMRLTTFY